MQPTQILAPTVLAMCLALSGNATAVMIEASGGSGPATTEQILATQGGSSTDPYLFWDVGANDSRVQVAFDAGSGSWVKEFTNVNGGDFRTDDDFSSDLQTSFSIREFIVVAGVAPITDWHVEIATPGWEFLRGNGNQAVGRLPDGTLVRTDTEPSGVFSGPFTQIDFFFDQPLVAGSILDIDMRVAFVGTDADNTEEITGTFQISQYPTVPEPATLTLMGLGIAGISYKRRKQIKAA